MAQDELWKWSAVDIAAAVAARKISAAEATEAAVKRMREANPAINAVVVDRGDDAIADAKALDQRLANGESPGSLAGVPITIKINVDTEGHANSNGVPAYQSLIAPGDSPIVANLKNAGAIIIGFTNTPEFSMRLVTDNPIYGKTINPWDPDITCGGSSGGAGASIAAGIGAIGHGNDIAGSLRWPAFVNGISTIRATQGRIPAYNPSATAERPYLSQLMSTQGPLAREIKDVRLGLEVMSRRDPRDPNWVPAPLDSGPAAKKVLIADIPEGLQPHPAVSQAVEDAAAMLLDAGYEISRGPVPDLRKAMDLWWKLIGTEMRLNPAMLELSSETMRGIVTNYNTITGNTTLEDYASAAAERTGLIREWLLLLEATPVVLSPLYMQPSISPDGDVGDVDHIKRIFDDFTFQAGINVMGFPAVVTPTGLHEARPIGVQLIASRFREDVALDAAAAIGDRVGLLAEQLWNR